MNQMNNQMMQFGQMSQPQLLQFINIVSFQVVDSQLYLDSHPTDEEAMKHFNYYRELRNNALKAYEKMYVPEDKKETWEKHLAAYKTLNRDYFFGSEEW